MADQVKFIHDALGESTISNMATEATLKELLNAIGTGGTGGNQRNSLFSLKSTFNTFGQKVNSLERGIKSTFRPFTGFISLLGKGEVRLSKFGEHLNDSLIAKLPIVGGLFSGVTGVALAGVGVLEQWNQESKKLAPAGATFGNSLLEFSMVAARSRLTLGELNTVVGENIEKFVGLGPNINQGIRNFSDFSDAFFRPGNTLNTQLINMGLSFKDINENMVDFLYYTRRSSDDAIETNGNVQRSFVAYTRNLDALTKVFGLTKSRIKDASNKILQDAIFQIDLNKKSPLVGEKTAMAADALSGLFGVHIKELFVSTGTQADIISKTGLDIERLFGGRVTPALRTLFDEINNPDVSADQFQSTLLDVMAEQIVQAGGSLENFQNLTNIMSVQPDAQNSMYGLISTIADTMTRKDLRGKTAPQVRAILEQGMQEQERTESITEIIRSMETAARYFQGEFIETVVKELGGMGNALSRYNLPELFRQAGVWAAELAEKSWQRVQEFYALISTEAGRDYFGAAFANEISYIAAEAKRIMKDLPAKAIRATTPDFINTPVSGANDLIRKKFNLDVPFIRTEYDNALEARQNYFEYLQGGGLSQRILDRDTNRKEFFDTKTIQEGTTVYPDWNSLGISEEDGKKIGPLTYEKGRWTSKRLEALHELQSGFWYRIGMSSSPGGSLVLMQQDAELQNLINMIKFGEGSIGEDRVTTLAKKSVDPRKSLVFSRTLGTYIEANAKYADRFQTMIDFLEGEKVGLKLKSIDALTGSMAKLSITTETHGSNWFQSLNPSKQSALLEGMVLSGLISSSGREANKDLAKLALENGFISALATSGGVHQDENKFRTGLENTGRLFNDFGRGKKVNLSGHKGIMTEEQYRTIKDKGASQIPMRDMINTVNSTVQEMIRLTEADIRHSKQMLIVA